MRLVWNFIEYFKSYSFGRQFRRQFSTVFHVILQAPSPGITATSLLIWQSLIKYFKSYSFRRQFRRQFSTVFHVILQAPLPGITATSLLIWQSLIKYFKSHSFCRQHRLLLRQVPFKFDKVWLSTSKVNNEISVKFDWVFQKLFIWTSIQTSILNRFPCNFAGNIDSYYGKFPVSLTKFD